MVKQIVSNLLFSLCWVGLLPVLPAFATAPEVLPNVVGEVTAVIGMGKVLSAQTERAVARGELIRAGDKIETSAGGHVHVRFIDGGLVSVRPLSRLHIEDYRNQDTQNLAAIKFKLDVGVMRSVTGQWGEAHRDRFRLNTPMAAIGIKGTDFVVKVDSGNTFVSVKTGAIVMSPLEGACALGLGPCAGERSALLSADMQGQMLEYLKQNDKSMPRLVPYVDLLARNSNGTTNTTTANTNNTAPSAIATRQLDGNLIADASSQELNNQAKEVVAAIGSSGSAKAIPPKDNIAVLPVAAPSVTPPSIALPVAVLPVASTTSPTVAPPIAAAPTVVAPVVTPPNIVAPPVVIPVSVVPEVVVVVAPVPASLPLIWLHNTQGWNVPNNTISARFDQASAAGRNVIIGNFFINLYRDETIVKDFTPPTTTANFNLLNASANYAQPDTGRPLESVSVSGAKMAVDFARNTLSTQMDLASPSLGTERFAATATVTRDGIFTGSNTSQQLAGAFSTDAKQAGYFFEKRLSTGTVSGLTLWGR